MEQASIPKPQDDSQVQEWEAILASENMPAELINNDIPSGDALDINDPVAAKDRNEQVKIEERSEIIFDKSEEQ